MAVEVGGAAGDEDVGVVAAGRGRRAAPGPAAVPPWREDQPADARPDELLDERVERGRRSAPPRERGEPLRPRVEADGEPVAGDREARARASRAGRRSRSRARRAWPRRRTRGGLVGLLQAARELERDGDAGGDRADGLEVRRAAALRAVEVDEVEEPGALRRRSARRSAPGGRSARRRRPTPRPVDDPRAAAGQVDRRDDCIDRVSGPLGSPGRGRSRPPVVGVSRHRGALQEPAVEADREGAVAQQRVVEVLEREAVAEAALLVRAQAEDAAPCPAGSSAGRSGV